MHYPKNIFPFRSLARMLISLLALLSEKVSAAEILDISPIRDTLLLVHVKDGTIAYAKIGEKQTTDRLTVSPVTTASLSATAFSITSSDDPAYSAQRHPKALFRKSKGAEFANVESPWIDGFGWKPTLPYAVMEHWIYLELPTALSEGKTYSILCDSTALNLSPEANAFTFSSSSSRSESIHVNIIGYAPSAPAKYGYIYHWAGSGGGINFSNVSGKDFHIVKDADDTVVFTGKTAFRMAASNAETGQLNTTPNNNYLGADVWECDFSSFSSPGKYRLVVPGVGCSFPFELDSDIYRKAFKATMKGLFQNRSGIELKTPFADKPRPAPHNVKLTPGFAGRLKYSATRFYDFVDDGGGARDKTAVEAGAKGNLTDTWGWYQDAGDWDGYFNHINVPNTLLLVYQLHPEKFTDGELGIPESGNGIPDLVDEGAWLPRFFARLRAELVQKGWGTGGVGSRVFGDYWGEDRPSGVMRGSWQDTDRDWYVTGEDVFSTFRYASTAAQLALIHKDLGRPDSDGVDWTKEATESFAWASTHVRSGDESHYEQSSLLKDHRALAEAALYRLTGDEAYHTGFKADVASISADTQLNDLQSMVVAEYLDHPNQSKLDTEVKQRLSKALEATALFFTEYSASRRACRYGGHFWFPMVIGQGSAPLVMPGVFGEKILGNFSPTSAQTVRSIIYTTSDYFLGINPLNMSWVTGLGPRFPTGIFHMDDWVTGPGVRTGIVTYGPGTFANSWIPYRMNASPWWSWDTTYPSIDPRGPLKASTSAVSPGTWPGHECFFNHRGSPQTAEFTIWQTILPSAAAYGILCDTAVVAPVIVGHPADKTVLEGAGVEFSVSCDSTEGVSFQWYLNSEALAGETGATLKLSSAQIFQAGTYSVVARRGVSTVSSEPAVLSVTPVANPLSKLHNISSRGFCGTGPNIMIAGFYATGEGNQSILARVVGPGLGQWLNPLSVLDNPRLDLIHLIPPGVENELIAINLDWISEGEELIQAKNALVGAFPLSSLMQDTATFRSVAPGSYTVFAQSATDHQGIALIEVYDANAASDTTQLMNISTRAFCGSGEKSLIAGFSLKTDTVGKILIRGMGPTLSVFSVPGVLENPELEIYDGAGGLVTRNSSWHDSHIDDEIVSISAKVGAFAANPDDREAVLLISLKNGNYTAVLTGANGGEGNALIEVYKVN